MVSVCCIPFLFLKIFKTCSIQMLLSFSLWLLSFSFLVHHPSSIFHSLHPRSGIYLLHCFAWADKVRSVGTSNEDDESLTLSRSLWPIFDIWPILQKNFIWCVDKNEFCLHQCLWFQQVKKVHSEAMHKPENLPSWRKFCMISNRYL